MDFDMDQLNPAFQDLGGYDRDPEDYLYDEEDEGEDYWHSDRKRAIRYSDYEDYYRNY
jgi:hypothetical protein